MGNSYFVQGVRMGSRGVTRLQAGPTMMFSAVLVTACATTPNKAGDSAKAVQLALPSASMARSSEFYPSTYHVPSGPPTLIRHATVLTGTGTRLDDADVLIVNGKIQSVGSNLQAPPQSRIVEGNGRWVTPGLIDVHSHLGVYPSPQVQANSDGNEATSPTTPNVWAEHSVWPQDPGFRTALAGGITSLQILPGSANLIGGRSVILKKRASS